MISFDCPSCGKKLTVKDELAGKKGKCPQCRGVVAVPATAAVGARQGGAARPGGPRSGPASAPSEPAGYEGTLNVHPDETSRDGSVPPAAVNRLAATATGSLGQLGVYKLLKILGQGGMGKVYQAQHTRLEKLVALKVLAAGKLEDHAAVSRFEREMKAVGRLSHPNIVQAMDAGEIDGTYFLVMEYVEGRDLADIVKKIGPLPIADACELVRQAAVGLQEAHEHGMVHRDIKPSNLMLTKSPRKRTVPVLKILDLGLALLTEAHTPDGQGLTSTGQVMGTIDYMAPEQGGDSHQVDIRADIYSLGATLFKLLTGKGPYEGGKYDTPIKKLMALATLPTPDIREKRADLPEGLARIVQCMLAKNPSERFATPEQIATALEPFCGGCNLQVLLKTALGEPITADDLAQASAVGGSTHAGGSTAIAAEGWAPVGSLSTPGQAPNPLGAGPNWLQSGPAKKSSRTLRGRWSKLPPAARIGALAGGGALAVLLGIVLLLPGKKGTVRIETNDPAIEVVVREGGTTIKGADKEEIKLTPGDQVFTIKRGDLEFETTSFALKKGDVVTLKIELLTDKLQATLNGDPLHVQPIDKAPGGNPVTATNSTAVDPQRQLAAWLLAGKHAFVTDKFDGRSIQELPADRFSVMYAELFRLTDARAQEFADLAAPLTSLQRLYLKSTDSSFSAAGLRQLTRIKSLARLGGTFGQLTASDLSCLEELPNLLEVNSSDSPALDDSFFSVVNKLPTVTDLFVNNSPITDAGIEQLPEMAQLKFLWLNTFQLTDKIWPSLAQLPKLENLNIMSSAGLTGEGVSQLRQTGLRKLQLSSNGLKDASLKELQALPALRELDIRGNSIGDEGLKHLAGTALTSLNLKGTQVTEQGVQQLAAALPQCRIEWNGKTIEPAVIDDRGAAEQLRSQAESVTLRLGSGATVTIHRDSQEPLPAEPFELASVSFMGVFPPQNFTTDSLLPAIVGLQSLEAISAMHEGSFSTAELARLADSASAAHLTVFEVGHCELTAETLDLLKKFPQLKRLGLRASRPTAELFSRLKQEHPALVSLVLCDLGTEKPLDEQALDAFASLPPEELMLLHSGAVDRTLCQRIAKLPNLKSLSVQVQTLNDESAAEFGSCPQLQKLTLAFTPVTDQLLPSLDTLTKLTEFNSWGTKITEPALRKFAKDHPKCRMVSDIVSIEPSQ